MTGKSGNRFRGRVINAVMAGLYNKPGDDDKGETMREHS
jgi:hypothetical protein